MTSKAMVEPLNTKAWQSALDALGTVKANLLEPDLRIAVSAYISALPSLPVVDGGELVERLAYRVGNPSAWPEGFDQKASDLFRSAVALISSQKQEIERLREALRPFADFSTADGEGFEDELFRIHDDHPLLGEGLGDDWHPVIYVKHFRAARAALEENGSG